MPPTVDVQQATPVPSTGVEEAEASRETRGAPLLSIKNLDIHFQTPRGVARVVDGANFDVNHQEIFSIAGESGSGKTTLVEAILQIIRFPNRVTHGSVIFSPDGKKQIDLMTLGPNEMRRFRGEHIAYIPQGSMNSLNPVLRIGRQLVDGMVDHGVSQRNAKARIPELLERVGLEARVAKLYPHELSGGMKQRVIIAIAISMGPELIVADEPTTALDVNVQRRILEALKRLRDDLEIALLIVSHDLPVHAQLADRIGIMYAGQIVETGDIRSVLKTPLHPYADGLMKAIPTIGGSRERIEGIGGSTPSPLAWPSGCRFHNRCPHAFEPCLDIPPILAGVDPGERKGLAGPIDVRPGRQVACHLYPESRPDGERP